MTVLDGAGFSVAVITRTPEETLCLGRTLGRLLGPGDVVALGGDLGAGKTVLARGIAEGLEVDPAEGVSSPSFTLVHEYAGRVPVFHIDLYRLEDPAEVMRLGLEEYVEGPGVSVVEWAERAGALLPDKHLAISLTGSGEGPRRVVLSPLGRRYLALVRDLLTEAGGSLDVELG